MILQVPAFTLMTSWPMENLLSTYARMTDAIGHVFSRLESSVREDVGKLKSGVSCAHLRHRREPRRPQPRVIVLTGPSGAAKRRIISGLVDTCPALFARVVTHTTRVPKEHEVNGVDYHFCDVPTLRYVSLLICSLKPGARTHCIRTSVMHFPLYRLCNIDHSVDAVLYPTWLLLSSTAHAAASELWMQMSLQMLQCQSLNELHETCFGM